MMDRLKAASLAVAMAAALLSGCEVDTQKHGDGDDVRVSTPFGGVHVKTNDAVAVDAIGLPAYPGAHPLKEDKDSADVNMSFGNFQLRVKAAGFRTSDPPAKVEAFYRAGMQRLGDVIECRGSRTVGSPTQTAEGLTCDDRTEKHDPNDKPSKDRLELKAGSEQHQHIVAIDPDGSGTKFGLVALDLPGTVSSGADDTDKQ